MIAWTIEREASETESVRFAESSRGPFRSVFGGVLAGIAVDDAPSQTAADYPLIAYASVSFVRPVLIERGPATLTTSVDHVGRRTAFLTTEIRQDDRVAAIVTCTRAKHAAIANLPLPAALEAPIPPASSAPARFSPFGEAWLGDHLEWRVDLSRSIHWFRRRTPSDLPLSPSAFAVAIADFATGVTRPDDWARPLVSGFPNPGLAISLTGAPSGDWIGLRARTRWSALGVGASAAELLDETDTFGMTLQSNVLLPLA